MLLALVLLASLASAAEIPSSPGCADSDRVRAPYLEEGLSLIRREVGTVRGTLIPGVDGLVSALAGRLRPETLALYEKLSAALDAGARGDAAGEGRHPTWEDAHGTRTGFLRSAERAELFRRLVEDLSDQEHEARETDRGLEVFERRTGKNIGVEVDPHFEAFFYGGFKPHFVFRVNAYVPDRAAVPRLQLFLMYLPRLVGGRLALDPVAPKVTDAMVLDSSAFAFATEPARVFGYHDRRRSDSRPQRLPEGGGISVMLADPGPSVSGIFEKVPYRNPCSMMPLPSELR